MVSLRSEFTLVLLYTNCKLRLLRKTSRLWLSSPRSELVLNVQEGLETARTATVPAFPRLPSRSLMREFIHPLLRFQRIAAGSSGIPHSSAQGPEASGLRRVSAMEEPRRSGCADHEDEGWAYASGAQSRTRRGSDDGSAVGDDAATGDQRDTTTIHQKLEVAQPRRAKSMTGEGKRR
jgi:hypothetical protein